MAVDTDLAEGEHTESRNLDKLLSIVKYVVYPPCTACLKPIKLPA